MLGFYHDMILGPSLRSLTIRSYLVAARPSGDAIYDAVPLREAARDHQPDVILLFPSAAELLQPPQPPHCGRMPTNCLPYAGW